MEDPWMTATVILGLVLILCIIVLIMNTRWCRKVYKREKRRRARIIRQGKPITATVTNVLHQEKSTEYDVIASWRGIETGRIYSCQQTFRFSRGALGFQPKIKRNHSVTAWVIYDQPTSYIDRNW
jgi:hypothetical protein